MNEDKEFEKHIAGQYPDPQLSQEVLTACERVVDLMKSPEGDTHHYGYSKPQKVTLTLPESFVHFALYLALFEQAKGAGPLWEELTKGERKPDDRILVRLRNRYLEQMLVQFLDREFEGFSTLGHPLLFPDKGTPDRSAPA